MTKDDIKTEDLLVVIKDIDFYQKVFEHTKNFVIPFNDVDEAWWYVKNFREFLYNSRINNLGIEEGLIRGYRLLLWQCSFIAMDFLTDDEIVELFLYHFSVALSLPKEIDLWSKLRSILITRYSFDLRDGFKFKLREALEGNNEIIINDRLPNRKGKPNTIGEWLADYRSWVGLKPADSLKFTEYFNKSGSVIGLGAADIDKVRVLLMFYEHLKKSSLDIDGLEDPIDTDVEGKPVRLREGEIEEIDPRVIKWLLVFKEKGLISDDLPAWMTKYPKKIGLDKPEVSEVSNKISAVSVLKSSQPAFLFDEEDEKEADRYREQVVDSQERMVKPLEERLRDYAKEIVVTNNLSFKDEINARRFELLFVSRLKEVRSQIEVKESLMKQVANGGLGLSEVVAEKVAGIIEKAKKNYESRIKNQEFKDSSVVAVVPSVRKAVSDGKKELDKLIAAELPVVLPKKSIALPPVGQTKETVKPVSKFAAEVKLSKELVKEKKVETEMDKQKVLQALAKAAVKSVPVQTKPTLSSNLEVKPKEVAWPAKSKPQLSDVKAPSKTLGPLDELRVLSLTDFRRLSPKATEALHKIQSKIELIGETSIAQKIEAIRSWQASAVYQNYLSLGRLSIQEGKPVSQIIIEKIQAGEPCLTEEEFQAIVDLNEKLRF